MPLNREEHTQSIADSIRAAMAEDTGAGTDDPSAGDPPASPDPAASGADHGSIDTGAGADPATAAAPHSDPPDASDPATGRNDNRDPATGRFVARDHGDTNAGPADENAGGRQDGDAAAAGAGDTHSADVNELGPLEPPHHWPLEEQQLFRQQPEPVQRWMMDRDKHVANLFRERSEALAKERRDVEGYSSIFTPELDARIAARQMDRPSYMRALAQLENFGYSDPAGYMRWFAGVNNLNPAEIFSLNSGAPATAPNGAGDSPSMFEDGTGAPPAPNGADPNFTAALKPITDRLDAFGQQLDTVRRADADRVSENVGKEVVAFRNATDANGNPVNPYFDEVADDMVQLLTTGVAQDVETAYQKAIWLNANVRAKIQAADQAAAARDAQAKRRAKAEAAQRAGGSVTGTPAGQGAEPNPASSVRGEVERQFANARAG